MNKITLIDFCLKFLFDNKNSILKFQTEKDKEGTTIVVCIVSDVNGATPPIRIEQPYGIDNTLCNATRYATMLGNNPQHDFWKIVSKKYDELIRELNKDIVSCKNPDYSLYAALRNAEMTMLVNRRLDVMS